MKKTFLSVLIMALVFCGVQSKASEVDDLYKEAYDSVVKSQHTRTQSDINFARERISDLVGKVDWAVGEFSKQVDTVQNPILVRIVSSIEKAQKDTRQYKINSAYKSIDKDLPANWRSSYSQAVDIIQQDLCKRALNEKEKFIKEKDEQYKKNALELFNDIEYSDNKDLVKWVQINIDEINNVGQQEIKIGQPIRVKVDEGEWEFTVEGTRITKERNEYSTQKPKNVIFFDYNYKNINYSNDLMVYEGMYYKLMDEEGNTLGNYPVRDYSRMPNLIPAGATCKATETFAIKTDSKKITVILYSKRKPIAKGVIDIK